MRKGNIIVFAHQTQCLVEDLAQNFLSKAIEQEHVRTSDSEMGSPHKDISN